MKGIFCSTKAKTDEEYREYLKTRVILLSVLGVIGFATIIAIMLMDHFDEKWLNDYSKGFISGIGSGLLGASVVLIIKNRKVMNDSKKLRRARIQATDERNIQISTAAMKVMTAVVFAAAYIIMLIGGIQYPILTKVTAFLICTAVLAYLIAYRAFSKKF